MFRLLPERPSDDQEVETLLDLAFAPGRGALSSYQLRAGIEPVGPLCTVARDEFDALVGAIRYWPSPWRVACTATGPSRSASRDGASARSMVTGQ
ncbi:MAG: hypothetical protein AAFV96_17510, partial [Pseudomonadota bacterium]